VTEFQLIERFLSPFKRKGPGLIVGPGDDCAVLRPGAGADLCVTTDALVEGVHFDPVYFSDRDIGHKALAVNLSDLAAMGAEPRWFLCSVACRQEDVRRISDLARGMAPLAAGAGILLAGGNFTRADALSIHITAAGEVPEGTALRRDTARVGDRIYVTGTVGDAALALALRSIGRKAGATLVRQLRPEPRLKAGALARPFAHAAIDVSDGLLQDLQHVLAASKVGASIDSKALPVSRTFKDMATNLDLALTGGEDYELLLFVPQERSLEFERAFQHARERVTCIGEVTRARGLRVAGAPHVRASGFDHFAGAPASAQAPRRAGVRRRRTRSDPAGRRTAN